MDLGMISAACDSIHTAGSIVGLSQIGSGLSKLYSGDHEDAYTDLTDGAFRIGALSLIGLLLYRASSLDSEVVDPTYSMNSLWQGGLPFTVEIKSGTRLSSAVEGVTGFVNSHLGFFNTSSVSTS